MKFEQLINTHFPVLDNGFVILDDYKADDLSVVNSARVSFNKKHEIMEKGDDKLIKYLLKNKHGTPFEHNFFRFRIKAPIFVFREWHRHRIGVSYNEWSARYSQLDPCFYIPDYVRTQVGKPGAYTYETADSTVTNWLQTNLKNFCDTAYEMYEKAILQGIAREQARLFLPVNIYSEMYFSCNARSLMAFLTLRTHSAAQWEIQQYANQLEFIFKKLMPVTWEAFNETREGP